MANVIFWDFDGTLVQSNDLWAKAMYAALVRLEYDDGIAYEKILEKRDDFGYPWYCWEGDYTHITTTETWWSYMEDIFYRTYLTSGVPPEHGAEAAKLVRTFVLKRGLYQLFPDSVGALEMAAKLGYQNYMLSNNYPELEEVLTLLDLRKHFVEVIVSGKLGYEKPRQEIFDYAKRVAGNPNLCFMIGDNPVADVEGGREAGMLTVLVRRGENERADYCLPDFGGLEAVLKKHLKECE